MCCAAAHVVLQTVGTEEFLSQVREKGEYLRKKIEEFRSPEIKGVRGMGLMLGLEVEPEKRAGFVADLLDKGVMVLTAGADVIRLLPPLVICYEEMDEALAAMKEVF